MMRFLSIAIAVLWLGTASALAQPSPQAMATAQDLFAKATTAYNLQRFDEAVTLFSKAYEAWPHPDFLYNIAQSHRLAKNCKQALYFYKRFLSTKDQNTADPLTPKKREEVERFITELTECVEKMEASAAVPPDTVVKPQPAPADVTNGAGGRAAQPSTAGTPGTPTSKPTAVAAAADTPADGNEQNDDPDTSTAHASRQPGVLSARTTGGIVLIGAGVVKVPIQPAFAVDIGYPLQLGRVILELGAGASFSPIPYTFDVMGSSKQGTLIGTRAEVTVGYGITDKVAVRSDVGAGIVMLGGLIQGNPFTRTREPGSFTMLSVRAGFTVDYAITSNVIASVVPFRFAFSPANAAMISSSLTQIEVAVGIGYRI
jgi:hypothetical protein